MLANSYKLLKTLLRLILKSPSLTRAAVGTPLPRLCVLQVLSKLRRYYCYFSSPLGASILSGLAVSVLTCSRMRFTLTPIWQDLLLSSPFSWAEVVWTPPWQWKPWFPILLSGPAALGRDPYPINGVPYATEHSPAFQVRKVPLDDIGNGRWVLIRVRNNSPNVLAEWASHMLLLISWQSLWSWELKSLSFGVKEAAAGFF